MKTKSDEKNRASCSNLNDFSVTCFPVGSEEIETTFGIDRFSVRTMRKYLSKEVHQKLIQTIEDGKPLDSSIAAEAASAMKRWALSRGATHHTHWFQPLTGSTAEKHDSFLEIDKQGNAVMSFSGGELIQGEPDASSFPSGGIRSTFEARGYTVWDPTSPAFIKHDKHGATLYIPTAFCSYSAEALDKKTPHLRSMRAMASQVERLLPFFGRSVQGKVKTFLGVEQEYFLVDKQLGISRPDLAQVGRTLFGCPPAKHQQMDDHYFGAIRPRVLDFMSEVDHELWNLGVTSKTRHNEVAPNQFEVAALYTEANTSVDQNMITMEVLRQIADRNGFICLLHEKPFAGINGSGKHCNWSIGDDSINLLEPTEDPEQNMLFLTFLICVIKAVDSYPEVLRIASASAGNDHRLGANEAPPAIMSVYLGEQLEDLINQIADGKESSSKKRAILNLGTEILPHLQRDVTDRNRTSPFAFTGNRFEFRSIGAGQNPADASTCLNTIVAQAIAEVCDQLEQIDPNEFNSGLLKILRKEIQNHRRVIFSGDGYSDAWRIEAQKRGLPNLQSTPDVLPHLITEKTIKLFEKHTVLSERELKLRYTVELQNYILKIQVEADLTVELIRTHFIPAARAHQTALANSVNAIRESGVTTGLQSVVGDLEAIGEQIERLVDQVSIIDKTDVSPALIEALHAARRTVDKLEGMVNDDLWPFPKYRDLLFLS